jgi:hypothetical protein
MNLFGSDQWKAFGKVKAHLVAKHAFGASPCAVGFRYAVGIHVLHEVFVLAASRAHKGNSLNKLDWSLNPWVEVNVIINSSTPCGVLTIMNRAATVANYF